ncbi:hypothetical protein WJX81_004713 [Elliptochloris bilobata]|uniref:Uncharacterized protein n=1 Tax=Elliptochloris bilobata TaxID=381761 RepID=A0AAW1QVB4_9CHLO
MVAAALPDASAARHSVPCASLQGSGASRRALLALTAPTASPPGSSLVKEVWLRIRCLQRRAQVAAAGAGREAELQRRGSHGCCPRADYLSAKWP